MHPGERRSRRRPGASWLLIAVGLLLVVGGLVVWLAQPSVPEAGPTSRESSVSTSPPESSAPPEQQVVSGMAGPPRAERPVPDPGAPERLEVPALGIDAPVIPVTAPGGVLTPPADPQTVGWWADGAEPGAAHGSALVTGHTVHDGGGAMDDLEQLDTGDRVSMLTDHGRIRYTVRRVVVLGKGELAQRAPQLFDQEAPGRLVLVTCEDWDGAEYLSNVVVTALPSS